MERRPEGPEPQRGPGLRAVLGLVAAGLLIFFVAAMILTQQAPPTETPGTGTETPSDG